jgi:phospholipid/cholesterol/gamma-HCH transport system permease protein
MTVASSQSTPMRAVLASQQEGDQRVIALAGHWTLANLRDAERAIDSMAPLRRQGVTCLDLSGLTGLDTAGALLIERLIRSLRADGALVAVVGAPADLCVFLRHVLRMAETVRTDSASAPVSRTWGGAWLYRIGFAVVEACASFERLLNFLGLVALTTLRVACAPRRLRWRAFFFHLEQAGLNAMPIVGLLSLLIGVVLAYQGADQLRRFGAEIFVVNLLGIGVLREIGVLMTAIIVAGRSGSAFTAQIGTMKVNQEVDAMRTLGLDPIETLALPRILALMVALPLLVFYANMAALTGGAIMAYGYLDITFGQFLRQLNIAVSTSTLFVGLIKAPVFAAVIALVGCHEGFKTSGSAESVGLSTTRSVVASVFLVIALDALFSVFFSAIGL